MKFSDIMKKCESCGEHTLTQEEFDRTLCVECYDMANEDDPEGMVHDDEY